ncbi:MAG: hypothetical protein M5U12_10255 [Verrucomicrobia bacterium]|nr:hypothetical protein [Verrucomicrobiota bacterium]
MVTLRLPALRERAEDVPLLVRHFLGQYAAEFGLPVPSVTPEALALLQAQPWPGNIRELENVLRRLLLEGRGLAIGAEAVEHALDARPPAGAPAAPTLPALAGALLARARRGEIVDAHGQLLAEAEREILTQAILAAEGNQAKAARWLGLSRLTLREKLTALGLRSGSGPRRA